MTKLSCITTVYNDGRDLMCSVRSVLGQTVQDFEYLIVDDGSEGDTREILAALDDPRIKLLTQANDGLSSARNRALEHVTGDYVCFLDADDVRAPWSFASILDVAERDDPDLIFCRGSLSEVRGDLVNFYDTILFDAIEAMGASEGISRTDPNGEMVFALAQLIEPQSANKVVRASLLKENKLGFPNGHFFEDIYFHSLSLALSERVSFLHHPSFTYFRRYGRAQITGASGDRRFDIIPVVKLTLEQFQQLPLFHEPVHRTALVGAVSKIMRWCENSISHQHRYHFRMMATGMTRMIDPLYFHVPASMPPELDRAVMEGAYLRDLFHAHR